VGGDQLGEVGEQRAALKAAGASGRESSFGESFTVFALGAERDFAVNDRRTERALRRVVRGLDAWDGEECPERWPDLEQVVREPPVPARALALGAGGFEQLS
jgi:hypothetical protein